MADLIDRQTQDRLDKMYGDVDAAIVRVDQALVRIDLGLAGISEAFPDGDRRRHCDVHLNMQRRESDRREFRQKLLLGVTASLTVSIVIALATAIVFFLKYGWMTAAP